MYVSRDGRAVRVHRDGSTTQICHVDRTFLAQMLFACQVACSSPSVRCVDVVVPGVPPGVKFEGRFHDSTLLRVEEISRHPSSPSLSSALAAAPANVVSSGTKEDVRIRIHLPNCGVGVARVEAVWSHGPCRNMPSGAGFPLLAGTTSIHHTIPNLGSRVPGPRIPGPGSRTLSRVEFVYYFKPSITHCKTTCRNHVYIRTYIPQLSFKLSE